MGVARVDIEVVKLPPKTKQKKNKKTPRKHKNQYNSSKSLNNSKHNKDIYLFNLRVTLVTDQHQGNVYQSRQHVLATTANYFH